MKSGKQRRLEIKERRRKKAISLAQIDTSSSTQNMPPIGSAIADHSQLTHVNTYGFLPNFYVDKPFTCRACGEKETWTAKQQKWWYEIAKAHIDAIAVNCRRCRKQI